jgi:pyridoxine 5-phosphate synthase
VIAPDRLRRCWLSQHDASSVFAVTKLSVNLNAVAYLRNRRHVPWPSVVGIARLVLEAGADGVTLHPRPDERHTRRTDVFEFAALMGEFPAAEFNIEGYPTDDFIGLVEAAAPDQVTLVPDDPSQPTSDHGWDFSGQGNFLRSVVQRLQTAERRVSLFCDPDAGVSGIAAAKATGARRIELYTGPYGGELDAPIARERLAELKVTADAAIAAGLEVNAGHDLTLTNLPALKAAIPELAEVSIGHGITADALIMGFPEAVHRYRAALFTPSMGT